MCACCRALIIGPAETPYANGCFIFDIFLPSNYPNAPPQVLFLTTGGKLDCSYVQPCVDHCRHWLQTAQVLLHFLMSSNVSCTYEAYDPTSACASVCVLALPLPLSCPTLALPCPVILKTCSLTAEQLEH